MFVNQRHVVDFTAVVIQKQQNILDTRILI